MRVGWVVGGRFGWLDSGLLLYVKHTEPHQPHGSISGRLKGRPGWIWMKLG